MIAVIEVGCLNTTDTSIMELRFSYSLQIIRGRTSTRLFYYCAILLLMLYLYQSELFTWNIKRTSIIFVKGSVVRCVE